MPGVPPRSVKEPLTIPLPIKWSNSVIPVISLYVLSDSKSFKLKGSFNSSIIFLSK